MTSYCLTKIINTQPYRELAIVMSPGVTTFLYIQVQIDKLLKYSYTKIMPAQQLKPSPTRRKPARRQPVVNDQLQEPKTAVKIDSINNILDFIVKVGHEPDTSQQQAMISEYAER